MTKLRLTLAPLPLFVAAACSSDPVVSRADLSSGLAGTALQIHGVSVEPETGRRFVLDSQRGVFLQGPSGFELFASLEELRAEDAVPLSDFTDLAAMGQDQFALIALNDGFRFDRVTGVFERFFCYLPGDIIEPQPDPIDPGEDPAPIVPRPDPIDPGEPYYQLANNLAYDAKLSRLVAQPQTFAEDTNSLLSAHIGTFERNDGTEQAWFRLPNAAIDAGGLAIDGEGRALLAWGTRLFRFSFEERTFEPVGELEGIVSHVDGLAFDATTDTALIVDDAKKELVEIDLGALID